MLPPNKWTVPSLRNHLRALINMTSDRQTLLLVYRILKSSASMQKHCGVHGKTDRDVTYNSIIRPIQTFLLLKR